MFQIYVSYPTLYKVSVSCPTILFGVHEDCPFFQICVERSHQNESGHWWTTHGWTNTPRRRSRTNYLWKPLSQRWRSWMEGWRRSDWSRTEKWGYPCFDVFWFWTRNSGIGMYLLFVRFPGSVCLFVTHSRGEARSLRRARGPSSFLPSFPPSKRYHLLHELFPHFTLACAIIRPSQCICLWQHARLATPSGPSYLSVAFVGKLSEISKLWYSKLRATYEMDTKYGPKEIGKKAGSRMPEISALLCRAVA